MTDDNVWHQIENIAEIDSPALVIYADRVKHNIDLAISMIGDPSRLRPHVKTHKSKEATLLMMEAGISKFKCATIAEAEMLGMCHANDVLLAYQPIGPKLARFIDLLRQYPEIRFACLLDNEISAIDISEKAVAGHMRANVFIDLNIGQDRTGILPANAAKLYETCKLLEGINVVGIHAYDGHIYNSALDIRKQKADAAFQDVENVKSQLLSAGLSNPVVVLGGTPTFPINAGRDGVECSPGTFIYWDKGYSDLFPDMKFKVAALLATRVVSRLNDTTFCLDLGHKSVAPENELHRRVFFLDEPGLKIIGQNEEHLVIELQADHNRKVGDVLYGIPVHICPTVALHERVFVVNNNRVESEWKTIARDRRITV